MGVAVGTGAGGEARERSLGGVTRAAAVLAGEGVDAGGKGRTWAGCGGRWRRGRAVGDGGNGIGEDVMDRREDGTGVDSSVSGGGEHGGNWIEEDAIDRREGDAGIDSSVVGEDAIGADGRRGRGQYGSWVHDSGGSGRGEHSGHQRGVRGSDGLGP
jgi:hypothetical protein